MLVICKMTQCPYYNQQGFCGKKLLSIDMNGMCSTLWKKGQQRPIMGPITEQTYPRKSIEIVEAAFQVYDPTKTNQGEETKSRSEDLGNGDAAS